MFRRCNSETETRKELIDPQLEKAGWFEKRSSSLAQSGVATMQEEFAPCWGSSTGVVARVEGLRGRMSESTRQVEGLFEALLNEAFQA